MYNKPDRFLKPVGFREPANKKIGFLSHAKTPSSKKLNLATWRLCEIIFNLNDF